MDLKNYIHSLTNGKQYSLAIKLIRFSLPIWGKFADKTKLSYRDSVVGLIHTVSKTLLIDTVNAVEIYLSSNKTKGKEGLINLHEQFIDPEVALQDGDWELPDDVLKTFFAVFNLIEALIENETSTFDNSTIYVSINQAIDALESSKTLSFEEINKIIEFEY